MPLIEAAGISVARIKPDSVKNSTPPERIWLSMSVSEPSWLFGKICRSKRPLGSARRHLLGTAVHRMRIGKIVGIFVGKFGRLGARGQRRADAAQTRRGSRCLQ